jgi:signal transduction histidine kinase
VLTVRDHGPGIIEAEQRNVLRRLYRLEQSRSTPGSGLGLSLVQAIADLHGAEISLSNAEPGLRVRVLFSNAPYTVK